MQLIRSLYIQRRFYYFALFLTGLALAGFSLRLLFVLAQAGFWVLLLFLLLDLFLLYRTRRGISARRILADRLSNGDENPVLLEIGNHYPHPIQLEVIDEVPPQFQLRDLCFHFRLTSGEQKSHTYFLRPVKRGAYHFGNINLFAQSILGFFSRRYTIQAEQEVPVYPSYLQMRKYELLAISNKLQDLGIKKIRRLGHNQEFEQIKEYVRGDDYRTLNWKATARRGALMVNKYQDERSQQVYSLIDKGRLMHMPFHGLSLLDYAINASLVLSNIAIRKEDKAGLMAFQHKVQAVVPASKHPRQMRLIQEALYKQKTAWRESDFGRLYLSLRQTLNQRSLLLLFTNFESLQSMQRQLPYLRQMAKQHLLVVILFENTEIQTALRKEANSLEEVYTQTVMEKLAFEKKLIVKELHRYGIQALLTAPEDLTLNTINKYLELKARGMI
ncbi:DUF58 domain-containing protein [Nafulsella turpanensis]|uniref:DUF58 domain-containing protein n=1 Tax=Nafulsella turpanensis TaxID=1265690 RepID=UPI000345CA8C|nr:DUF58 domain-containing protein [Nafulsella turpanensis]